MVFASAAHGWAFDLRVFAERWAKKLGMKEEMLRRTLWGEFYFQPKGPKVVRSSANGRLKPMFVQFVLTSVWQAYGALLTEPDAALRDKIVTSLGLSVPERELRHADAIVQLRAVFGAWLPLSANVLRAVAEQPRAAAAQTARLPRLCPTLADADLSAAVAELSVAADAAAGAASLGALRAGVEGCATRRRPPSHTSLRWSTSAARRARTPTTSSSPLHASSGAPAPAAAASSTSASTATAVQAAAARSGRWPSTGCGCTD